MCSRCGAHIILECRGARSDHRFDSGLVGTLGALVSDGKDQRQANLRCQVVGVGFTLEVLEVILDLVGDAERFAVLAQDVVRLSVRTAQDCAQT